MQALIRGWLLGQWLAANRDRVRAGPGVLDVLGGRDGKMF